MIVSQKTCSRKFREIIAAEYPTLNLSESYWKAAEYFIFGTYRDELHRNELVISAEILARIEKKTELYEAGNYNAEKFLESIKRDVLPDLAWNDWSYAAGQARTLEPIKWPNHIKEAIRMELSRQWAADSRVYFVDGRAYSLGKERLEREGTRIEALNRLKMAGNKKAEMILMYLNKLKPNKFSKIRDHINDAYIAAAQLKDANDETIFHQIAVLRAISDQPQVFYQPSRRGKTVRIFGLNESILSLKKEVRRALTPDWVELDIVSSQLAINAMLWNVSEIDVFLLSNIDIWASLFNHFGIEYDAVIKQEVFKKALYALSFGMARKKVYAFVNEKIPNGGKLFFSHPIIKALYRGRQRMIKQIENNGGAYLIDGTWLSIKENTTISILAQMAQAVELEAIYEAYQLASTTNDFTIMLHQHDGISISFNNRKELWLSRIAGAVNIKLAEMNVNTIIK